VISLATSFEADCKASIVQRFRKYLIRKELVALTGIEPGFPAFLCFFKSLKALSDKEMLCSLAQDLVVNYLPRRRLTN